MAASKVVLPDAACGKCKKHVVNGFKCDKCDNVFHPSCAKYSNSVRYVSDLVIICCEDLEESEHSAPFYEAVEELATQSGGRIDTRIFNYILRSKDIIISELREKIVMLTSEIKVLKDSNKFANVQNQKIKTQVKRRNASSNRSQGRSVGDDDFVLSRNDKPISPGKVNKQRSYGSDCSAAGENFFECNKIDYFTKEEYNPDPEDSTMAIPYTVTRCVIFFISATFLLCCGYCCCLLGQCIRHRTMYTFVSGVIFIITGLVMLFGLIMYISIFKAEIGAKLRPKSMLQPPAFYYWYGYSFLLYVGGLVGTQVAGVCCVFLFIYKAQYDYRRKHLEDLRRGKLPPLNSISAPYSTCNYTQYDPSVYYPCRRHPQAYVNSNSHIVQRPPPPPPLQVNQRRYFFSKEPMQDSPCSIHTLSRSEATSLKDLSGCYYDFPPPPTISYRFPDDPTPFPRDLTVSTTASVEEYLQGTPQEPLVTFGGPFSLPPVRPPSVASIGGARNGGVRGVVGEEAGRRTTPV